MDRKKLKDYFIIVVLLVVFSVLLILILNKNYKSDLLKIMPQINYNELDNYILDNYESIIYLGNKDVSNRFEQELLEYIKNKNINIIYMYVNKKDLKNIKEKYNISDLKIPNILIFKNGNIEYIKYNKIDIKTIDSFFDRNEV